MTADGIIVKVKVLEKPLCKPEVGECSSLKSLTQIKSLVLGADRLKLLASDQRNVAQGTAT